jgi:hypothetical protein
MDVDEEAVASPNCFRFSRIDGIFVELKVPTNRAQTLVD